MSNDAIALNRAFNDADQNMSSRSVGSPVLACGDPLPDQNVAPTKTHWIAIKLVDELGKGVPYEDYQITLPDGTVVTGSLDKHGLAKITGIDSGTCQICFRDLDKTLWDEK